jgi:hypothetical protein
METTKRKVNVMRLMRGTELRSGEIFINARRDNRTAKDGKITVRLFDAEDNIVSRRWYQTVNIEVD